MPYKLDSSGNCVVKSDSGETVKCHDTHEEALNHLRALEANVNDSVVEMSLRITKASYNKSDDSPRKWTAIDSDIDDDLYQERMSLELYQDFDRRIKNNEPVPEAFKSVICEEAWCGGMPYLSIAHYRTGGDAKNVPGDVTQVYIDGTRLKSKGTLHDTPIGRKVFDALVEDLYKKKSGDAEHLPVRISIGFLDLEHKHRPQAGGQEFTFVRNNPGEICPLCSQGIGGKIYTKGQLVHLAMTRVPVNPRTEMSVERSMEITSKRQDAESIVGDLANELEEKSIASDMLVVRSDGVDSAPVTLSDECEKCFDPNTNKYDQACIDAEMEKFVGRFREDATVKSKALFDVVGKSMEKLYKLNGQMPVVEESMANEKDAKVTSSEVTPVTGTVEKGVLGIPEKPFAYAGLDGNGNNNIPAPVKAKDEESGEDTKDDEKDEMEKSFAVLRKAIAAKSADEVNKAFQDLGTIVENKFNQPAPSNGAVDMNALAEIIRSSVASAVQPLQLEIAALKAQTKSNTVSGDVVKSRALTLSGLPRPEDMLQKSLPSRPQRKLSQIEEIAYRSTGALR